MPTAIWTFIAGYVCGAISVFLIQTRWLFLLESYVNKRSTSEDAQTQKSREVMSDSR